MPQAPDTPFSGSSPVRTFFLSTCVTLLGIVALVIGLFWYMPARALVHQANRPVGAATVSGRVVQGAAQLPQGYRIEWRLNPWRSLLALSPTFDVTGAGPGADLAGRLSVMPGRQALRELRGTLAWPLVAQLVRDPAVTCHLTASAEDVSISRNGTGRRAEGGLRTSPVRCARSDGTITGVPVPPLVARLFTIRGGVQATLAAQGAPDTVLATATLTDEDRLILRFHAAGARLVPGMPASADSEIALPLSALLR